MFRSIAMNFDGAMAFGMAPASMAQRFNVQKVRDLGAITAHLSPQSRCDLGVIASQAPALFILFPDTEEDGKPKLGPDGKPRQAGEHQLQVAMFSPQARLPPPPLQTSSYVRHAPSTPVTVPRSITVSSRMVTSQTSSPRCRGSCPGTTSPAAAAAAAAAVAVGRSVSRCHLRRISGRYLSYRSRPTTRRVSTQARSRRDLGARSRRDGPLVDGLIQ